MNAEHLLTYFDRIVNAPEAVPRLQRFILDLAVRGKLVEQDPKDESATEAVKQVWNERERLIKEGRIWNRDTLPPVNPEECPFIVPTAWTWVRTSVVAESRLGKMLDRGKNKGTPRPYLRNINVRWLDFDLSDLYEMRFEDSELEEYDLRTDDVLICEGGEPGRAAVWDSRASGLYFQKAIHRVRFLGAVVPKFFVRVLSLDAQSGRLEQFFTGTGIQHFTGKGLARYFIPLPPLAEQHRIVAKVDELMALCDRLEARLTAVRTESGRLLEAVLHETLAGSAT